MPENVFDIFTPGAEVKSIEKFAGRTAQLDVLADALQTEGSHIVIYGSRGVGKSSLARQLMALSLQDSETISRLTHKPLKKIEFLPILFKADDSVTTTNDLIVRLLTDAEALAPWIPLEHRETIVNFTAGISGKVFGTGAEASKDLTETYSAKPLSESAVSTFFNTVSEILKTGVSESGILIIIDEFDRISDRSGFASVIKSAEGRDIRFALVGVARDVVDLLKDHASIQRQIATGTTLVPPMTDEEVGEVFQNAHERLEETIVFSDEAQKLVTECARGHPYLVHLIGRQALITAARAKQNVVTETAVRNALKEIALQGDQIPQERTYRNAIRTSPIRETILKKFASRTEDVIRTTEIYEELAKELGVPRESLSQYVGHLLTPEYGAVLEKAGERYYSFTDSVFKAYAAARPQELTQE